MLDAFLEVVCGQTKQAEARARTVALLERLPLEELHKIASGELAMPKQAEEGLSWLDQFRGTPLLDQAIAIEKEDLDAQMEAAARRRQETAERQQRQQSEPSWEEADMRRDDLRIKRKLLELELAGADVSASPEDAVPELGAEEPPVDLEAAEVESIPEVPKATPPAPPAAVVPAVAEEEVEEEGPSLPVAAAESAEDKPAPKKPPTTKVTKETTEKPAEEKIDIKAAAARMRFSLAVKEAGLSTGAKMGIGAAVGAGALGIAKGVAQRRERKQIAMSVADELSKRQSAVKEAQPANRARAFQRGR